MTAAPTRLDCGTRRGVTNHTAAGEPLCAECRWGIVIRALELERVPAGFPPPARQLRLVDADTDADHTRRQAELEEASDGP